MFDWKRDREGVYSTTAGHMVTRMDDAGVQSPIGRWWGAIYRDGTYVQAEHLGLPYEGVHRFKTLRDAQWYLQVNDRD